MPTLLIPAFAARSRPAFLTRTSSPPAPAASNGRALSIYGKGMEGSDGTQRAAASARGDVYRAWIGVGRSPRLFGGGSWRPLAMQKVVGTNPISRSASTRGPREAGCLAVVPSR
jgi:hypothetical protein